MTTRQITVFQDTTIAIERPRSGVYHAYRWNTTARHWFPIPMTSDNTSGHMSLSAVCNVTCNLSTPTGASSRSYAFTCDGRFIRKVQDGRTINIPILKKNFVGPMPQYLKVADGFHIQSTSNATWAQPDVILYQTNEGTQTQLTQQPTQTQTQTQTQRKDISVKLPARVLRIFLEDAINKGESCPITMEDITMETARVTSCFHIFQGDAIQRWLQTSNECPVCKEQCKLIATELMN